MGKSSWQQLVNDAAGWEDAVKPMKASFPRHFGACLCLSCLGADRVSARPGLEMQFTCVAIRFCFACAGLLIIDRECAN